MSSLISRSQRDSARRRTRSCLASAEVTLEAGAAAVTSGCVVDAQPASTSKQSVARTRQPCREMATPPGEFTRKSGNEAKTTNFLDTLRLVAEPGNSNRNIEDRPAADRAIYRNRPQPSTQTGASRGVLAPQNVSQVHVYFCSCGLTRGRGRGATSPNPWVVN